MTRRVAYCRPIHSNFAPFFVSRHDQIRYRIATPSLAVHTATHSNELNPSNASPPSVSSEIPQLSPVDDSGSEVAPSNQLQPDTTRIQYKSVDKWCSVIGTMSESWTSSFPERVVLIVPKSTNHKGGRRQQLAQKNRRWRGGLFKLSNVGLVLIR